MPEEKARVDNRVKCGSREIGLSVEEKALRCTSESPASSVSSKDTRTADPDNLPQLGSRPVGGANTQSQKQNNESLCTLQVPAGEVCRVNGECRYKTSDHRQCLGYKRNSPDVSVSETSEKNNRATCPRYNFFLPTEEEAGYISGLEGEEATTVATAPGACGIPTPGAFYTPTTLQTATPPDVCPVGRQLQGPHHLFTIVPVNSSELHAGEPESSFRASSPTPTHSTDQVTCPYLTPRTPVSSGGAPYSSYNNNLRGTVMGRRLLNPYQTMAGASSGPTPYNPYRTTGSSLSPASYNPYQTMTGARISTTHYNPFQVLSGTETDPYNPYHTISGMVPSSYQRSEYGLQRVPTYSRREYGVGGSSCFQSQPKYGVSDIPPSLASVVLPRGPMSPSVPFSKSPHGKELGSRPVTMHRVSTMPAYTNLNHLSLRQASSPQESFARLPHLSPEQLTFQSINQLTVRSAGGLSVDVGSTDGRNVTVHGAVISPEQLPFIPSVDRGWQDDERRAKGLETRQTWGNKAQFVLACVGSAVGLGNLWRFPYLCYKSGGGAFLIPYFIMLFLCGIPLLLMELTVGQYTRRGPVAALEKICPLFKGAGVGSVVISFLLCTYYNVIIAWAIFYLVQSFYTELPWSDCNTTWAVNCFDDYGPGVKAPNGTKSATEEFFDKVVLQKSEGINEMGSMRIELLLALFLAWLLVYFSLWKSVKSSGRVVYVTATVPYVLIGAFLWRALTLPGANKGLQYFFGPRWELLLKAQVWVNAAAQNFNSIGIAFGSMMAFSSYNKFNNNIVIDTWIISLVNAFTSLLAGMIVFSTLGNIALEQGKDIDDVVAEGPGLVFMVYPQALAKMPYANLWAILFFMMLLILGLDSQFATVEVIITSLQDGFPKWIQKYLRHHEVLVLIVCIVSFFFGLPNIMQGGIYFFQLIDYYTAAVSLMYLAFFEVAAIVWFYGAGRLARNVREMTGRLPSRYFRFCWYFAAPMLILAIWVFSMVDYKRPTYNKGEYSYPDWAIALGWVIAALSIIPIPIFAVIAIFKAKGTNLLEKLKNSVRSSIDECPCCGRAFNCLDEMHTHGDDCFDNHVTLVVYGPQESNVDNKSDSMTKQSSEEITCTKMNGETKI